MTVISVLGSSLYLMSVFENQNILLIQVGETKYEDDFSSKTALFTQ